MILIFFLLHFYLFFSSLILLIISILFLFQYLKYCSKDYKLHLVLLNQFHMDFSSFLVSIMISGSHKDRSTRVNGERSSVLTLHFYRNSFRFLTVLVCFIRTDDRNLCTILGIYFNKMKYRF